MKDAFKWTKGIGMSTLAYFIIGSPTETKEQILRTIEFAKKLNPDFVHFSEVASYPNPKAIVAGLLQGAPLLHSEAYFESTGKQAQSWFHRKCNNALLEKGLERLLFLPWTLSDKYSMKLSAEASLAYMQNLSETLEEYQVVQSYGLTAGQLLWRKYKIEELDFDLDLFKREYPLSLQECFMSGSDNFFYKTNFVKTERWKRYDQNTHILAGHPNPKLHYSLGADVAAGVEKDRSTIEIVCVESQDVVAEFKSDTLPPDMFALEIENLGHMFNWPIAIVESNNHGGVTLDNLLKNKVYPINRIFFEDQYTTPRAGFNTNRKTKYILLGKLRQAVATDLTFYSQELGAELSAFTEELKAVEGYHDDLVIALALANYGVEEALKHLSWEKSNQNFYRVSQLGEVPGAPFDALFGQKTISGIKQQIKG